MKITLRNVEREFNKLFADIDKIKLDKMKLECINMLSELSKATPVDTGRAAASWHLITTGNVFIPFKLLNDTEYIQYLNAGSSKQAPSFFVERIALKYGKPVGTIVTIRPDK